VDLVTVGQTDTTRFCREIERYLCRKNDGHLIRIVGPAFETVSSWAARGVPLTVACRGIDRYIVRYYAKGPRRRPVRVEFCEADVLDAFDEWRRAVGARPAPDAIPHNRRKPTLSNHLERVIAQLTASRTGRGPLDACIDAAVGELDAARGRAKGLRGGVRETLRERLREIDRGLLKAALIESDPSILLRLTGEADAALEPFRDRMPAAQRVEVRRAAIEQLVRDHARLPTVAFD
jgi:hypothetical protein